MSEKNPAAVMLGRLGGLKGGKARAESLTPERRREIAARAARTRWADICECCIKWAGAETKKATTARQDPEGGRPLRFCEECAGYWDEMLAEEARETTPTERREP